MASIDESLGRFIGRFIPRPLPSYIQGPGPLMNIFCATYPEIHDAQTRWGQTAEEQGTTNARLVAIAEKLGIQCV